MTGDVKKFVPCEQTHVEHAESSQSTAMLLSSSTPLSQTSAPLLVEEDDAEDEADEDAEDEALDEALDDAEEEATVDVDVELDVDVDVEVVEVEVMPPVPDEVGPAPPWPLLEAAVPVVPVVPGFLK
jgi:hypothetical protein